MSQTLTLPTYSALYAFGDSLSDAGNLSLTTQLTGVTPVSPPYYQENYGSVSGNVFSNGPTWVQDLSGALGLGTLTPSLSGGSDYAYGGAETGSTPQNASDPAIQAISLGSQFTQFQGKVSNPSANALFTVSIGSNDLLDILSSSGLSAQQQTADVNAAVANEISFINQLVGDGAKNLLVLDVPDLSKTPDVLLGVANGTGTPSAALTGEASQLASEYNAALSSQLTALASAHAVSATVIDAYKLIDNAVANPAAYGLTNVTSPVWSGNYTSASSGTLAATTTATQDQFLFWDHLHPTETGHQALTSLAETALSSSPAAQITLAYNNILQRAPDPAGLASWQTALTAGSLTIAGVSQAIATSPEAQANVVPIVELYTALGRAPDATGLQNWVHAFEAGTPISQIAGDFLASPEGVSIYGNAAATDPGSNASFIDTAYSEVLGRTPDPTGQQNWNALLNGGSLTRAQLLTDLVQSPEAQARDATPVTNFLAAAGEGTANYGGNLFASGTPAGLPVPIPLTTGSSLDLPGKLAFVSGNFGSSTTGAGLTATAANGIVHFAGAAAATDSLQQLIAATANVLDAFSAPVNGATVNKVAAFEYGGNTYVIEQPASGTALHLGAAGDHVFELSGVTGATAISTHAAPHTILV